MKKKNVRAREERLPSWKFIDIKKEGEMNEMG